ncbi:S8 family serine peptidase [uncultured Erythrobacter sp.]|uniref:S8 family serine peptidase n=1 Tax=uncultured Erythrobacter sp. TaxID=263913 RepID=UPI002625CBCC|nr:S8 family serine peptidase [uncultured Erythrobacter sp.]
MRFKLLTILAALIVASPLAAQLQVPGTGVGVGVPPVGGALGDATDALGRTLDGLDEQVQREARSLLRARDRTLSRLLRRNRDVIERDADGDLARRGELIAFGLNEPYRFALIDAGFTSLGRESIEGLDLSFTRLAVPEGMDLADAQALAGEVAPGVEIAPDHLHFQSGNALAAPASLPMMVQSATPISVEVGVIDGAPAPAIGVMSERGFARGAPKPSDHGSAVASLLRSAGVTRIRIADVYGEDPAGGNALAIARALGWLVENGSKVVSVSLVGPRNALVERAVNAARTRGVVIVAAVGNDGPAAPPAFPASYEGVVAVTGVDRRERALIEAGRALHLDYAAPGDRVYAMDARGRVKSWRGTSFATPLVAARIAAALQRGRNWRRITDAEARDLGARGPDDIYGRGLLCRGCGE